MKMVQWPLKGNRVQSQGEITSRINQQDHIRPQVFFPSIVTLKDPTEAGFLYVFNNILRTRHYGAQTTRTGRVRNELLGVIFADGEIISNLRWTQAIYDLLPEDILQSIDPLEEDLVMEKATEAIQALMSDEFIVHTDYLGEDFKPVLAEVKTLTGSESGVQAILTQADKDAKKYAHAHIKGKKEDKKEKAKAK
jgi:CRISPR-associated protein Csc2